MKGNGPGLAVEYFCELQVGLESADGISLSFDKEDRPSMAMVTIDGAELKNWRSFHSVFQREFEFPAFYGRNLNAWIDCLTYLRDDDGMSRFKLAPEETLNIVITNTTALATGSPEILAALVECTSAVNIRSVEAGQCALLVITFQ